MTTNDSNHSINTGYAFARLQRAVDSLAQHEDPEVRARAAQKAQRWLSVLEGIQSGTLTVGSRTPVADAPAWVTLEVAHGGFATGRYVAEASLDDEERQLLASLPASVRGETDRERLNSYFLTDAGLSHLRAAMADGLCRIEVPEEAALPVVSWLLDNDSFAEALQLVETLRPLMHSLRFYPRMVETPRPDGTSVRLSTVANVAQAIRQRTPQAQVAAMNEALAVWNPLYDQLVALWLETVDGDLPQLDADGGVTGGWPASRSPADWAQRRTRWLSDYATASTEHTLCSKHLRRKSNLARLRVALERCEHDSAKLSGRDVGWIRRALANTVAKHGAPGSESRQSLRRRQADMAARPTHSAIGAVVVRRLERFPADGGIPSLDPITADVSQSEADDVPVGTQIPSQFVTKAARALEAPIDELVARGVIGSAEVLAAVLPQISAQVAASGIADRVLRDVYTMTYTAFRRRRSLLLLNLEHQVSFDELPWIAVLGAFRSDDSDARAQARQTLEQVTILALSHFPHTILPNPLVREMSALAKRAELDIPLVEEIAADIFMGTFTTKWLRAGRIASELLGSTLYARYYDLPPASAYDKRPSGLLSRVRRLWNTDTAEGFAEMCRRRAKEVGDEGGFVARNGAILEQSQILTTHNLASLCVSLDLRERVAAMAPRLVDDVFRWIARQNAQTPPTYRARLQLIKNTAYAWRQAIFLLSLCNEPTQGEAIEALYCLLGATAFGERFRPVVAGLRGVFHNDKFDRNGRVAGHRDARRLLGWSVGTHWLMPVLDSA